MDKKNNNMVDDKGQNQYLVAYLGPEATYSHQAAIALYGNSENLRGTETIEDVFKMVESGDCDQGVVPVENSYEGSVNITLDFFYKYEIFICGEGYVRIRHNLLSLAEKTDTLKSLYSHPQALAQCRSWIKSNLKNVSLFEVSSTAMAAQKAVNEKDSGAIGSRFAGEIYGLSILKESIEDDPNNVTRFFVIGKDYPAPTGNDKTSIIFSLHHKPGTLYRCLKILAERNVNMTRIESRPMKTKNWEYLFFVDLEGHADDGRLGESLREMEEHCVFMKRLGSYPRGGAPWD